ncbi:SdpI family protein [Kocuria sediminis]|uniref:SdpI family protein n=1 Tax=Kocuria sediminis TaxID=1038857 RepID=UPI0012E12E90
MDYPGLLIGVAPLFLGLAVLSVVASRIGRGTDLEPNRYFGIRTRHTLRSAEQWNAGHLAARPALLACAVVTATGYLTAVALIVAAPGTRPTGVVVLAVTLVVAVFLLITAAVTADRRARRLETP